METIYDVGNLLVHLFEMDQLRSVFLSDNPNLANYPFFTIKGSSPFFY